MAYYQGDYYQGDYYQGEPFIGALVGGAVSWLGKKLLKKKAVASTAALIRTPGIVPPILKRGIKYAAPIGAGAALPPAISMAIKGGQGIQIPTPGGGVFRPGRILPGGVPAYTPGCCPTGYHMDKATGTRCVKNRRMNVANPVALRRSLRRVAGFGKLAQRSKKDIRRAARAIGA
jgi:hypothetical protein